MLFLTNILYEKKKDPLAVVDPIIEAIINILGYHIVIPVRAHLSNIVSVEKE